MKFLLALALPLYALDQATKWWIIHRSGGVLGWEEEIVPGFFHLVYWGNTGAAFSLGKDNNWFFVLLSLLTLAGLLIATARGAFADAWSRWGVGLLVAGILGNVTDRLIHHHVVDFLLFDLHVRFANPWPAFNVADSAICTAVGCFLIASLREGRKAAPDAASSDRA
jgi:signal peptidase II